MRMHGDGIQNQMKWGGRGKSHLWLWSQPLLMRSCGRMNCAYVCATSALYAAMRLLSCLRSACIFCTALLQPDSPHPNACMQNGNDTQRCRQNCQERPCGLYSRAPMQFTSACTEWQHLLRCAQHHGHSGSAYMTAL